MTSAVEFINRWQRIALLSHSLLELAQRGEWDLLLEQEVTYLQRHGCALYGAVYPA